MNLEDLSPEDRIKLIRQLSIDDRKKIAKEIAQLNQEEIVADIFHKIVNKFESRNIKIEKETNIKVLKHLININNQKNECRKMSWPLFLLT